MSPTPDVVTAVTVAPPTRGGEWEEWGRQVGALAGTSAQRVRTLTPEDYGAVGDGVTDDQAALQAMLDDLAEGDHVRCDGVYRHGGLLRIPVPGVRWRGGRFLATDRSNAAIQVTTPARGLRMVGVRHVVDPWDGTGTARGGTDIRTAPFAVWDVADVELEDCSSQNSAQCGFYLSTVKRSRFIRPAVERSFADGFHMTHNCEDLEVDDPTVLYPGDDSVAVVSYLRRGSAADAPAVDPCRRITVRRPVSRYTHARGLSVVGGEDITYTDVDVAWTRAAGVMIAAEAGYNTHPAVRCVMRGGRVQHAGFPIPASGSTTPDAALDHGSLFMVSQQAATPITDSGFEDIEVSGMGDVPYAYTRAITNNGAVYQRCFYRRIRVLPGRERDAGASIGGTTAGVTYADLVDLRTVMPRQITSAAYAALPSAAQTNPRIQWMVVG